MSAKFVIDTFDNYKHIFGAKSQYLVISAGGHFSLCSRILLMYTGNPEKLNWYMLFHLWESYIAHEMWK